ncbi:unnamed protein product [Rotaria magnacalcarata]|nr:unnamed protein product [Rotaria magnacalcarata]
MSTAKSQTVSNPSTNSIQTGKTKDNIPALKNKITELERQINDYKIKLDELRRAKATTVVKLEKEYVNTTVPGLNRSGQIKSCEKCEEFERMIESERKSTTQLKKMIEQKDNSKQQLQSSSTTTITNSNSCPKCSDFKQLLEIEKQNNLQTTKQWQSQKKQREEERNAKEIFEKSLEIIQSELIEENKSSKMLREENKQYKNKFELMKKEHDEKMAQLCQREEETKKEIETWEQMYHEWMATMERRVNNLQVTDQEFQTLLHNENENSQSLRSNRFNNQRQ